MDVLEKIREEERAKLEALKEKEQEKTRLAIEKERTRLEAELAKEIKDLESQLNRAKNASQNVKARTPISNEIPAILVDDILDNEEGIEEVISVADEATKKAKIIEVEADDDAIEEVVVSKSSPAKEEKPKKTPAAKKTTTKKKATTKTALQKEKEKEKAKLAKEKEKEKARLAKEKEKEKEKARLAKEKEKEKEKAKLAKEKEKAKLAEEKAKEAEKLVALAKEAEAKEKALLQAKKDEEAQAVIEKEVGVVEGTNTVVENEVEVKNAEIIEDTPKEEAPKVEAVKEAKQKVEADKAEEKKEPKPALEKIEVVEDRKQEKVVLVSEEKTLPKSTEVKTTKPNTAMTSLQKLREKIAAQKRLERELMEREAQKVQEKEKTLQEKFLSLQRIVEEEENIITLEELEQERINVDSLRREKEDLESYLENLQSIVDKVVDLKVDGIKVINSETWELTEEFQNLGIDSQALNRTVLEIEEEVDALSKSHEEYINKIIQAEDNYKTLEALYQQQEQLIEDLNKQVNTLREQVAKEKVLNREYSTQIERLKSEKTRLEKVYKYTKPTLEFTGDVEDEEVHGILSEIERLNEEVRKLVTKDYSMKVSKEIEEKDLEIEALKLQIEELRSKQTKPQQEFQNPYYANPANMFIPSGYPYQPFMQPQPGMFDVYLQEVEKLRREIENMKHTKMEEPIAKPEVFEEKIQEVKAEPSTIKEEESKNDEQIKMEKEVLEKDERINELEKQIQEKDQYIEKIKKEMNEYTEEDIFDPNFKRKIRVIRDKKAELINRNNEEEQLFNENTKEINNQIKIIKTNIDQVKDRIFDLDMNFRQNRDYSSAAKDEYEKAKGKALVELQLQEEKLNNFNQDLERAKQKYERIVNSKAVEMEKLDQEELETIRFYLNKMIQGNKISNKLKSTEEEKQNLVEELDQLKSDNNLVTEIDAYAGEERKKQLSHKVNSLENEIKEQTRQYNIYYEKITELKSELTKRLELENNLKQNDEDVFEYTSIIQSLEDCEIDYNQKNERIAVLQLEIENNGDRENVLRKKAEISDLLVHREDLKTKMDFFKAKLVELEANSNIVTYKKINNQINQIKKVSKDHRLAAEAIKAEVQNKTMQLEKMRNELKGL